MARKLRRVLLRYFSGVAAFAAIILIAVGIRRFFSLSIDPTTLLVGVVIATSWYAGRWPGLLVVLAYEVTIQYFAGSQPLSVKFAVLILNRLVVLVSLVLFVSSRRTAQDRVKEEREWLRVTLASIGDCVIATDSDGAVRFMNSTAESLTGWRTDEAIGKPIMNVFSLVNEVTRQPVESPVVKVLREGSVAGLGNHTVLVAKDGKEIPIDDSGAPIRGALGQVTGVILVFRDITERKRAEEARVALAAIVESSDDAIIGEALDGTIVNWNQGAERLYGYSADEVKGRHVALLIPPERTDDIAAIKDAIKRGDSVRQYQTERITKDGRKIQVSLTVSPLKDSAGGIKGASIIGRDITQRKKVEKEREELLAREQTARLAAEDAQRRTTELLWREEKARKEAEVASRLKDEFLNTVSHELRAPLNSIYGWATVLRNGGVDTVTARRATESIERNARAQKQLIDDLLDVSRIISGKMQLNVQAVHLGSFIPAAVDSIRPAAQVKGINLQIEGSETAGYVSADPGRLQQVLWNLLANAVKFTPPGGSVEVGLTRRDGHVEIRVSDTGEGIDAEFLPYVFDRFRQADGSITRKHGGLGLGLAIVRQLVELHGGRTEALSAGEGQGATFVVTLPVNSNPHIE